jgi:hypothetical protein
MPLTPREKATLTAYFAHHQADATFEIGVLEDNGLKFGTKKISVSDKYENYEELKWWLKSKHLINTDLEGIQEVVELIDNSKLRPKGGKVEVLLPPPVNVPREIALIKTDCAYSADIDGVYVQIDVDQNKHQPKEVPIGTRQIHGEKFGTYATTAWHQQNTMRHMANWAKLQILEEGQKIDHGQSKRVDIATAGKCSFEGFVKLLGGKRYVSFHCYPNSK